MISGANYPELPHVFRITFVLNSLQCLAVSIIPTDREVKDMGTIHGERLMSLTQATKILPGRPSVSTLHRWRVRGIRGVILETLVIGGRRFTSVEALERFAAATTAARDGRFAVSAPSSRQRQRDIAQAEAELERLPSTSTPVPRDDRVGEDYG